MDSFAEAGYLVMGLDYFRGVREASFSGDYSQMRGLGPCLEASKE